MHYAAMRELDDRPEVLNYLLEQGFPLNDIMFRSCEEEYRYNMHSGIGTHLQYSAVKSTVWPRPNYDQEAIGRSRL